MQNPSTWLLAGVSDNHCFSKRTVFSDSSKVYKAEQRKGIRSLFQQLEAELGIKTKDLILQLFWVKIKDSQFSEHETKRWYDILSPSCIKLYRWLTFVWPYTCSLCFTEPGLIEKKHWFPVRCLKISGLECCSKYINFTKNKKVLKRILALPGIWSYCNHKSLFVGRRFWGVTRCYVLLIRKSQNKLE